MSKRATLKKKPSDVAGMFDEVAARYDIMNDLMTIGQVRVWREAVSVAIDAKPGILHSSLSVNVSAPLSELSIQTV